MARIFFLISLCIFIGGYGVFSQEPAEKPGEGKSYISPESLSLNWLQSKQNEDGSWGTEENKDVLTALATHAFLSRGYTPGSEEYGATILRAIKTIVARTENFSEIKSKSITIWCVAEFYGMTKIPMLQESLSKLVNDWKYDPSSPWDLLAICSCYSAGIPEIDEKIRDEKLKESEKYFEEAPKSLLTQACKMYLPSCEKEKFIELCMELEAMSPEKWKESKNPILTMLAINMVIMYAPGKMRNEWNKIFWKEAYKSQETKGNMGWWTAESLGITGELEFPSLSEGEKDIYTASMFTISYPRDIHFPRFMKPFDKNEQKTNNDNVEGLEIK